MTTASAEPNKPQRHKLKNGLTLVTLEEHKAPVVTFQVWYKVGSRDEQVGKTGLAHLTEHLMFKGTGKHPTGEFSQVITRNGGSENAFTSKDYTAYYENFASDRLDISLKFESDRMINLIMTDEEFQTERDVVTEERRLRTEDNPQSFLIEAIHAVSFMANPYRNPIIGWMDDLGRLTRDNAYEFYKSHYAPNNATVVIVGDFVTAEVVQKVEKYFSSLPALEKVPSRVATKEPEQFGARRVIVKKESHLPFTVVSYKVPNYADDDSIALSMLAVIMSHGRSSRLFKRMVYEEKIALDASADYNELTTDPYLFYFYGMLQQGSTPEDFEKMLDEEIEKIKTAPVTDLELEKARNQLEAGHVFAQDSNFYQAMNIGIAETIGAGFEYLDIQLEKTRLVTKKDIMRVANRYFVETGKNVGVLVPKETEAGAPHGIGHSPH